MHDVVAQRTWTCRSAYKAAEARKIPERVGAEIYDVFTDSSIVAQETRHGSKGVVSSSLVVVDRLVNVRSFAASANMTIARNLSSSEIQGSAPPPPPILPSFLS